VNNFFQSLRFVKASQSAERLPRSTPFYSPLNLLTDYDEEGDL